MAQQGQDNPPAAPPPAEPPDKAALLFAAIRADDVQQLERALSEGASVDSTAVIEAGPVYDFPPYSSFSARVTATALMLAIRLKSNRIARLLLERGADTCTRGPHWISPLPCTSAQASVTSR